MKALCVWLCWNYCLFLNLTLFKIKTLSFLSSACNWKIIMYGMFPNTWMAEMLRKIITGRNFSESHLGQVSDKWHCLPCRPTVPHRATLKMCCFPTTQVLEIFFQLKLLSKTFICNATKQTYINIAPCSRTRNIYQISL